MDTSIGWPTFSRPAAFSSVWMAARWAWFRLRDNSSISRNEISTGKPPFGKIVNSLMINALIILLSRTELSSVFAPGLKIVYSSNGRPFGRPLNAVCYWASFFFMNFSAARPERDRTLSTVHSSRRLVSPVLGPHRGTSFSGT